MISVEGGVWSVELHIQSAWEDHNSTLQTPNSTLVKVLFLPFVKCRKMGIFAMDFPQNFLVFYGQM